MCLCLCLFACLCFLQSCVSGLLACRVTSSIPRLPRKVRGLLDPTRRTRRTRCPVRCVFLVWDSFWSSWAFRQIQLPGRRFQRRQLLSVKLIFPSADIPKTREVPKIPGKSDSATQTIASKKQCARHGHPDSSPLTVCRPH